MTRVIRRRRRENKDLVDCCAFFTPHDINATLAECNITFTFSHCHACSVYRFAPTPLTITLKTNKSCYLTNIFEHVFISQFDNCHIWLLIGLLEIQEFWQQQQRVSIFSAECGCSAICCINTIQKTTNDNWGETPKHGSFSRLALESGACPPVSNLY